MRGLLTLGAALVLTACSQAGDRQAPSTKGAPAIAVPAGVDTPDLATVTTPTRGARVTSPLRVSGVAPADWFFENQFPVRLVSATGEDIVFAPATPRVNWTEPGPKAFDAELIFDVTGPATLVLEEDMPQEGVEPRRVSIPVILE